MLISTSAASALWTGSRRLRAVSSGTLGGPLKVANSHPLAIPRGGQLGDSLAHECGEAAAYGFVYAIAAALTGGVAERIFPGTLSLLIRRRPLTLSALGRGSGRARATAIA